MYVVSQKTGARIKIYSSCCPDSTDRVVQLTGAGNTAIDCLKEILELIRTVSSEWHLYIGDGRNECSFAILHYSKRRSRDPITRTTRTTSMITTPTNTVVSVPVALVPDTAVVAEECEVDPVAVVQLAVDSVVAHHHAEDRWEGKYSHKLLKN